MPFPVFAETSTNIVSPPHSSGTTSFEGIRLALSHGLSTGATFGLVFVFAGGELPAEFLQRIGVTFRTEEMLTPSSAA